MCSIVGYISSKPVKQYMLDGLARLEYRGYDSAGIAVVDPESMNIRCIKVVGGVQHLMAAVNEPTFNGYLGIGHTRWATHGKQTIANAHPHFDCTRTISVVHNGIFENYASIKAHLIGLHHTFISETDTEVIAHFLEEKLLVAPEPLIAIHELVKNFEGRYALVIVFKQVPGCIFFVRKGSPLSVGFDEYGSCIASDILAFHENVTQYTIVPDNVFGFCDSSTVTFTDFSGHQVFSVEKKLSNFCGSVSTEGFQHFMLKEIYEQPVAIARTVEYLRTFDPESDFLPDNMKEIPDRVSLLGCGGSWHAAAIGKFFFEEVTHIPTTVHLASEFRYSHFFPDAQATYLFLSQSGETADTLEALRLVNQYELATLGIANVASSALVRETDFCFLTQAGPEIAVASTKAFSTQLVVLYWLAHYLALKKGLISQIEFAAVFEKLLFACGVLEHAIQKYAMLIKNTYAPWYAAYKHMICLGKHISYPFALEAALKLKEIAYIFAQAYPAGELKHGPLALVDQNVPIMVFSVLDPVAYKKLINSVHEAKARDAHIVAFGFVGQHELQALADVWMEVDIVDPLLAPLAQVGLMQYFVYEIARHLDRPIDKPRNLAKSVTVE